VGTSGPLQLQAPPSLACATTSDSPVLSSSLRARVEDMDDRSTAADATSMNLFLFCVV
jgi:hypothetical protein